jgi:hypothetical protein
MSALDVSAVVALANKAMTLREKGSYARAAELFARAAAAAQALGARDCLVVAALQLMQADCWLQQSKSRLVAPADVASMRDVAFALLPVAKATLLRRKAAGTLLCGTCAPHEEAWELACLTHSTGELRATSGEVGDAAFLRARVDASMLPALAPYVGYNAYLSCARIVFMRVILRKAVAEMRADVAFVCDALDMMSQPLALDTTRLRFSAETALVHSMRSAIAHDYISATTDDVGGAQLLAAWDRVERSGVLQARNIGDAIARRACTEERVAAFAAAALAAKGLRVCALDSCGAREVHASQFKLCGACKTVCYCSREHQAAHWRQHKAACKAACNGGAGGSAPSDER